MGNDSGWQRRSDEWVKASHESRKRKERKRREAAAQPYRPPVSAAKDKRHSQYR